MLKECTKKLEILNLKVSGVGQYRDEETFNPLAYFDKIITDVDVKRQRRMGEYKIGTNR